MQRRSILTFVDRDVQLMRATEEHKLDNDQVALNHYVLIDSKSGEIVAIIDVNGLFDQDGNRFVN